MGRAMELQKIRQLIDVFKASDLAEFEFTEGDQRVRFVKRAVNGGVPAADAAPLPAVASPGDPQVPGGGEIKSPLYGIVHLTPTPNAPPFVQAGDVVQPGQVLCIVEAMKIFHEVKATHRARVDKVLVAAADEVEAGAGLFATSSAN